jgi:hypothetical protein
MKTVTIQVYIPEYFVSISSGKYGHYRRLEIPAVPVKVGFIKAQLCDCCLSALCL